MKDTGCSGYVVKASEFTKLLPPEIQPMYEKALADNDLEYVDELLDVHAPLSFPTFDSPFILGDEDNTDNLEKGVVYICFDDDDLYVKQPTPGLEFLQSNGVKPEYERWTTWG